MSTHSNTRRNSSDAFTRFMDRLFGGLSKHVGFVILTLIVLFLSGVGGAYWMSYREQQEALANNAYYLAEKAISATYIELEKKNESPEALPTKKTLKKDKARGDKPQMSAFSKLDVDSVFADPISKLVSLDRDFKSSRVAFESRLRLGNLYFNHGQWEKARNWFDQAAEIAPRNAEKASALGSLGYALENLDKPNDAVQVFQRAIDLGDGSLRDDFLMASARCYEKLQDFTQARRVYDQVLTEFPHSEISRSAEILKNRLQ